MLGVRLWRALASARIDIYLSKRLYETVSPEVTKGENQNPLVLFLYIPFGDRVMQHFDDQSGVRFYSIGIVVEDKTDDGDIIKVTPIESLPQALGVHSDGS